MSYSVLKFSEENNFGYRNKILHNVVGSQLGFSAEKHF